MTTTDRKIKPPTPQQYRAADLELIRAYTPKTKSCKECGWPVIKGYCCTKCESTTP